MTNILLVHGAWHGAWCWDTLAPHLAGGGARVHTVELPFTGVEDDARAVGEVLDRIGEPTLLVGHSYGGIVISKAAAGRDDVSHLAYLCAMMLADGDDVGAMLAAAPPAPLNSAIRFRDDGLSTIDPEHAVAAFYGLCPPESAAAAITRLRPFDLASINGGGGPISIAEPWRTIPSSYLTCLQDGAIPIELQRTMAVHADTVVDLDTDHSPFVSRPADTAAFLLRVAG